MSALYEDRPPVPARSLPLDGPEARQAIETRRQLDKWAIETKRVEKFQNIGCTVGVQRRNDGRQNLVRQK